MIALSFKIIIDIECLSRLNKLSEAIEVGYKKIAFEIWC